MSAFGDRLTPVSYTHLDVYKRQEEYSLLSDFLYEAIYIPDGTAAPPKSVITCPELQVYIAAVSYTHLSVRYGQRRTFVVLSAPAPLHSGYEAVCGGCYPVGL